MSTFTSTSYDRTPYSNNAFRETHPARMRTAAILFGLESPPLSDCRVLDLGCGRGGNLVPMAYAFPGATFLGIDLSGRQIEEATQAVRELGLRNIDFRQCSIMDVGAELGSFDYVICHGVFSWVPREVQGKIFEICRDHLTESGVALVSFNAYPGSYARRAAREMMMYHAAGASADSERVDAAREILQIVAESAGKFGTRCAPGLLDQWKLVSGKPPAYVLHEYLEDCNEPAYFHEFMERAGRCELQYLADALSNCASPEDSDTQVAELLASAGSDGIRREQYLDFVRDRSFRRALLCHRQVKLDRTGAARRVPRLQACSCLQRPAAGNMADGAEMDFAHPTTAGFVRSAVPLVKAALTQLQRVFPQAMCFDDLCACASSSAGVDPEVFAKQREELAEELLGAWMADLLDLYADPLGIETEISERPEVSAVARRQARLGERVPNLRHEMVELDENYRRFIQWVDGTRTDRQLAQKVIDEQILPAGAMADEFVRCSLEQLAKQSMLVR